jgi:hypothetical protein
MSARQLILLGMLAAGLIAAVLVWNRREQPIEVEAQSLIFPDLAQRQDSIDGIRVFGAGNALLVSMKKQAGIWRVLERNGWPADAGKVGEMLFLLSQARLQEAKTADPSLYARIGVESLADHWAQGLELRLDGGGKPLRLLIGHAHVNFDGNYVRVNDGAQSWLSDRPLTVSRDPVEWLDHHLIDRPLARIEQVQVVSTDGGSYSLAHRDDRFRLTDMPSAAMGDSHAGDAMAGFLDQLELDDVADDDGKASIERRVDFLGVDGVTIEIDAWREKGKVWARLDARIDESRAGQWLAEDGKEISEHGADALKNLHEQVAVWQARFAGKRFLLPNFKSAILLMSRGQILKGAE